ncbi:MAG: PHP domain-containing protein [Patescibacteria group bacterium]
MIDLHTHSLHSDGTETPRQLVERAEKAHLALFAIADHDTVAGLEEAVAVARELQVRLLPAIELTVDLHGGHVHILGYGIDWQNKELREALVWRQEGRRVQFYEKVRLANERLRADGKSHLDAEALLKTIQGIPGRPHIAHAIVAKGWEPHFRPAFDKYLLDYVPETTAFKSQQAIELIHRAGGIASLAHPGSSEIGLGRFAKTEKEVSGALKELIAQGIDGVEAWTPAHTFETRVFYEKLAQELHLIITGGTDWHGPTFDAPAPGEFEIPDEVCNKLKSALKIDNPF